MTESVVIISCLVMVVSALVTPLFSIFFRKAEKSAMRQNEKETTPPNVSILLTAFGHSEQLANHLPAYLTQDYNAEYEIVVVAEKGDIETENVLERYANHPHIYITFIPDSSRYMSRKKLSATLGVKAAKHEWIIMAEPSLIPDSDHWLKNMTVNFTDDNNLVMGYTHYTTETPTYYMFEHFHTAYYLMRKANNGTAFRTNMPYIAFRKSEFLDKNGFQGNLKYLRGEYDFIINKYAKKNMTVVETAPETWMTESCPTKKDWRNKLIYYQETKKHLRRKFIPSITFLLEQVMMYLNYAVIFSTSTLAFLNNEWIIVAVAGVALIITVGLRTTIARKALLRFQLEIPGWKIVPYELRLTWTYLLAKIRHAKADKYDFISHKL